MRRASLKGLRASCGWGWLRAMAPEDKRDELADKVSQWVETAGFALELRVARLFAQTPGTILVQLAQPYFDKRGARWRETDVVAYCQKREPYRAQLIVECKAGGGKPWVVFTDRHTAYVRDDVAYDRILRTGTSDQMAHTAWRSARGTGVLPTAAAGYGIAEADIGNKHADRDKDDPDQPKVPYRAVMQAVDAALALHSEAPSAPSGDWSQFAVPVVVTGARLFEVGLAENGSVQVIETQASSLLVQPRADSVGQLLVHVVTEAHMPQFLQELQQTLDFLHFGS